MPRVLLIHGVHADTTWQDRISFVLRPHFEPVKITYEQFQQLGTVSLLSLEGILRRLLLPFGVSPAAINGYRMAAMASVANQMGQYMTGEPPHIIAHSFGTYLTAIIFQRYEWARADRIIFAGAAVAEDFPWGSVHHGPAPGQEKFNKLRNDWFPHDSVIELADWVKEIPWFGCAGAYGFNVVGGLVHSINGSRLEHGCCRTGGCVPIHNVRRDIGAVAEPAVVDHSLVYLTPANVAQFWLPYLWGIDAAEYEDVRSLSRGTQDAHSITDVVTIGTKVGQLLDPGKKYSWWQKPLLDHLRELLNRDDYRAEWKGKTEKELLGRIPEIFLLRMNSAELTQGYLAAYCDESGFSPDEPTWDKVRDLDPRVALFRAIDQVLHGD
jgi:pimeloyl-ACP methyl ester carboxylesterase